MTKALDAAGAEELRAEIRRLTGIIGHIREHIARDEDFDADELRRDIEGSVDLAEFDRFQLRAEKAEQEIATLRRQLEALEAAVHGLLPFIQEHGTKIETEYEAAVARLVSASSSPIARGNEHVTGRLQRRT